MASQQHQPPPNPQSVLQQQQQAQQQLNQQQDFDPVHRFKMLIPQLKESLQNVMSIASQNFVHNSGIDNGILMSGPATFIGYSVTFSKALCENSLLAGVKKQLMTATCPDEISKSYAALNIKSMSVLRFRTVRAENPLSPRKNSDTTVQRFDKSLEEFYALCDQLELCLRLAHECLSQSIDSAKHSPNLVPTATKPETVQNEALSYSQYLSMIKSQISCAKDIHNALLECSKKIAGKGQPQGIL